MVYLTFSNFFLWQTTTNNNFIRTPDAEFPAVTICNLNSFDMTASNYTSYYINQTLARKNYSSVVSATNQQNAMQQIADTKEMIKAAFMADNSLSNEELQSFGWTLQTMLISCFFEGSPCDATNFTWSYSYDYGNCYTFNHEFDNSGNAKSAIRIANSGPATGLSLELFVGFPGWPDLNYFSIHFVTLYTKIVKLKAYAVYSFYTGAYVLVNNRLDTPLTKYDGVRVQAGMASNIAVTKTTIESLGPPYGDCKADLTPSTSDSIYFNLTSMITTYRNRLCVDIYFQLTLTFPTCGCFDPAVPSWNTSLKMCDYRAEVDCANSQRLLMNKPVNLTDCPIECNSEKYSLNINSADYPTDYYANLLLSQQKIVDLFNSGSIGTFDKSTLKNSMLMIDIYLDDLQYLDINQTPAMTWDILMGNLGKLFYL